MIKMIKNCIHTGKCLAIVVLLASGLLHCKKEENTVGSTNKPNPTSPAIPPTQPNISAEERAKRLRALTERIRVIRKEQLARRSSETAAMKRWLELLGSPIFQGKGKAMDPSLWVETLGPHDPYHRLKEPFQEWEDSGSTKDFIVWLENEFIPAAINGTFIPKKKRNLYTCWDLIAKDLKQYKAIYLTIEQRKSKEVTIKNGVFYDHTETPFHTGRLSTNHSGRGAAVFVLGQGNKLYAGSHGMGVTGNPNSYFFHSGFLAGARVLAAGEIGVKNGNLRWVSSKSGHYKPGKKEVLYFLQWLQDCN